MAAGKPLIQHRPRLQQSRQLNAINLAYAETKDELKLRAKGEGWVEFSDTKLEESSGSERSQPVGLMWLMAAWSLTRMMLWSRAPTCNSHVPFPYHSICYYFRHFCSNQADSRSPDVDCCSPQCGSENLLPVGRYLYAWILSQPD